jgi:hypothetical protein
MPDSFAMVRNFDTKCTMTVSTQEDFITFSTDYDVCGTATFHRKNDRTELLELSKFISEFVGRGE